MSDEPVFTQAQVDLIVQLASAAAVKAVTVAQAAANDGRVPGPKGAPGTVVSAAEAGGELRVDMDPAGTGPPVPAKNTYGQRIDAGQRVLKDTAEDGMATVSRLLDDDTPGAWEVGDPFFSWRMTKTGFVLGGSTVPQVGTYARLWAWRNGHPSALVKGLFPASGANFVIPTLADYVMAGVNTGHPLGTLFGSADLIVVSHVHALLIAAAGFPGVGATVGVGNKQDTNFILAPAGSASGVNANFQKTVSMNLFIKY